MANDPMEEFEFKPLTEGLGFHKKQVDLKGQVQKSGILQAELGKTIPSRLNIEFEPEKKTKTYEDLLAALEKPIRHESKDSKLGLEITQPLPRDKAQAKTIKQEALVEEVLRNPSLSPATQAWADPGVRRGAADSPQSPLVAASACVPSAVLDMVVIFALSLIFVVSLLMVTKVDLLSVMLSTRTDLMTQVSFALLFVCVLQMYVVIARSFFGRTLGEWTFDHQMGTSEQHQKGYYPILVTWRSLFILLTGVVVFPVLSLLFGKDLTAKVTGLQLYRQRS